jgi:hypothetical protein
MKPEGNKVGNWTGWNAKPQRPIGYEEESKAHPDKCVFLKSFYPPVNYFRMKYF